MQAPTIPKAPEALPGCKGFFPTPNRLFVEGCRHPVALAVYASMAATPHVWGQRGTLNAFRVRASQAALVNATGATVKEVRRALAWLIRRGFLERVETSRTATAVFRIVTPGEVSRAKRQPGTSPTPATPSATASNGKGPSWAEKGQAKGQVGAKANGLPDNEMRRSPQGQRAKLGAKVSKTSEDKDNNNPPNPPADRTAPAHADQGGGVASQEVDSLASDWAEAFRATGRDVPAEGPKVNHPDRYRASVLRKLLQDGDRDALLRDMATFAGGAGGDVSAFETWLRERREGAERERAYTERHGLPAGDWKRFAVPVDFNSN